MISKEQATVIIEQELPSVEVQHFHLKSLYQLMQKYASRVTEIGDKGDLKRFETQLMIANRIYSEGSPDVREVMEKVFISTLSHSLERKANLLTMAKKILNVELLNVMRHDQLSNNP